MSHDTRHTSRVTTAPSALQHNYYQRVYSFTHHRFIAPYTLSDQYECIVLFYLCHDSVQAIYIGAIKIYLFEVTILSVSISNGISATLFLFFIINFYSTENNVDEKPLCTCIVLFFKFSKLIFTLQTSQQQYQLQSVLQFKTL